MATPQLSPGVLTREVDLTVGRADNVLDNIGGIAGPFPTGPVDELVDITTEQELINVFGKPISTDAQYGYWMSAASYLGYGGVLKVGRTDGTELKNANAGVNAASASLKIKNYDDYLENFEEATNFVFSAKTPGAWANNLKICTIDDLADQTLKFASTALSGVGATVGYGVSQTLTDVVLPGTGTTSLFSGYIKGIVTGVTTSATAGQSQVQVKVVERVDSTGTATAIDYAEGSSYAAFTTGDVLFHRQNGDTVGSGATPVTAVSDWYDEQTLGLTNATVYWKSIAPKPTTNNYSLQRQGKNDATHVVVVDDLGDVTGITGSILEKHVSLSKALDSISDVNSPQKIWYEQYLALYSENVYAGGNPGSGIDDTWGTAPAAGGFTALGGWQQVSAGDGIWGQEAQGVNFASVGNVTYDLTGGVDYSTANGMKCELGDIINTYNLFSNKDEVEVDYLIMGPSFDEQGDTQAKANYLISIANQRKDCMATVGPHKQNIVNVSNSDTQTDNLTGYFSSLQSSSYATFDSGYKYTYDRFNNKFRWIPTNADIAGLMARTSLNSYPWFSPAGQQRGVLNNAIKLAYNPNKAQRDLLYPLRVNSVITQPGVGTLLFGDKTALGYASAFDRINVRRLFLTIEQALQSAAEAQLFELNDELTRANFKNIVEPYLRDVQAKRGLYGFLVICDTTNNTPDVIDNNEFRADIFLKPAKSINYVTLTFVATRTGVSFEEVAGRV